MKYNVYGDSGIPVIAFPTSEAHYSQWEDFGMIDAVAPLIESGKIQIWTVDTIDNETFFTRSAQYITKSEAMKKYEQYQKYLRNEFLPLVRKASDLAPILTGCSMGAYHAANYFFRNPSDLGGVIALSGVYSLHHFLDDNSLKLAAANSPLVYLSQDVPASQLESYKGKYMYFSAGQGEGEEDMRLDTEALFTLLESHGIPGWVDIWGESATHDWPWWYQQFNYALADMFTRQEAGNLRIYPEVTVYGG
jgi:esterase/lipase superfamily enzyme